MKNGQSKSRKKLKLIWVMCDFKAPTANTAHTYICICVCMYMVNVQYVCIYMYVGMYVYVCMFLYVCMYIRQDNNKRQTKRKSKNPLFRLWIIVRWAGKRKSPKRMTWTWRKIRRKALEKKKQQCGTKTINSKKKHRSYNTLHK